MKKYSLLLFFVLLNFTLLAQNKNTKTADKLFIRHEYVAAIKEYQKLADQSKADGYVYKQLAESYGYTENTVEAEKWYAEAIKSKQEAETYYKYAQVLKENGKYEEANRQLKTFADLMPNDPRTQLFLEHPDYISKLNSIKKQFEITPLTINSNRSDFGAVLHDKTLYFTSARNEKSKLYGWNNEPYLDLYTSEYQAGGTFSEPAAITELNTIYHEGPATISKDGTVLYFSSESFNEKLFDKDKTKRLKLGQVILYKATHEDGKWSHKTPLAINSKSYSVGNPSIAADGKTLYFSSDMPGSVGGADIWKVNLNADGTFGNPENLGTQINTVGDENFPFITDSGILYFASNTLIGFGGYDIFSANLNTNAVPVNVGKPVNSEKDDFAFSFYEDNKLGFVSSNRLGSDDIFSLLPVCEEQLTTVVKDAKAGTVISNAKVVILDQNDAVVTTLFSNDEGEILYIGECQKTYNIQIYKDGFITQTLPLTNSKSALSVALTPLDVKVTETEIVLNPIYFDLNKSIITQQAASELDKLVYIMSQNQELKILVKSHTDSQADAEYNLKLSDRRATATVAYIISKGIHPERVSSKGLGESEPKVACGDHCTEAENALNRRSEFMIVK
ncbi:OmpA family protein [Flavobacterium sp. GA093]|uniref:OmpA family protein n=1 Tax=Flavobacterium hydrocarbonoxydans TaxID=2683249 RepID=A0A6I4NN69_9FLAO|nr:OmpA family protein [Flavobacterium hydrocarbonoxydans]MWB95740.1 OmpA family protein [Flavobacterium hydrocarbonoxydans]